MLSTILVLLISAAQLHLTVCSGGEVIDYENQQDWDGYCNKEESTKQSPVNVIVPKDSKTVDGKLLNLPEGAEDIGASNLNNKNTIKIKFSKTITYKIPGLENTSGEVVQLHLHWGSSDKEGSEHLLDGKRFSAESHLVTSYKNGDKLAVIARLFEVGKENKEITKMLDSASSDSDDDREISNFNLKNLYPSDITRVIVYNGSLTTPDCAEIVHWVVVPEPLTISIEQLEKLRKVPLGDGKSAAKTWNWRKEQKLNGRSFLSYTSSSYQLLPSSVLMILVAIMMS